MNLNELIDQAVELAAKKDDFRGHLGGSMIGRPCDREIWYGFRWALQSQFKGRMLRLFDRGQREEFRFITFLSNVGVAVREIDPATKRQWRILDVDGHFGGSLDGIAGAGFAVTDQWGNSIPANTEFLTEFKTHNTKSFCNLVIERVAKAKPVHYKQMQIYMHKCNLSFALYMAVNKNDDDLYTEVVWYDPAEGQALLSRAHDIIYAPQPPKRIGSHAAWYDCKFCDYKQICHFGAPMLKNCRTCRNSEPVENGRWQCNLWKSLIPSDAILAGCDSYVPITY